MPRKDWGDILSKAVEIAEKSASDAVTWRGIVSMLKDDYDTPVSRSGMQEAFMREFGIASPDEIVSKQRDAGAGDAVAPSPPASLSYVEEWKRDRREIGWREIVEHARKGAELQNNFRPVYTRATRKIITNKPVFVSNISDLHLGCPHADYLAFVNTTDLLLKYGFYLNVVGADIETAFTSFKSADAVLNQTLPPWLQIEMYRQWIEQMLPKTLSLCGDNHTDERLERFLGDIGLVWRDDIPYFRAWGILDLYVGPDDDNLAKYTIVEAHKYRGSSTYHNVQPALKMMHDIYPLGDVYVTAHTHVPTHLSGAFFPEARPENPTQHFIVCGTFKTGNDVYSLRNFGGTGVLGVPTLMLWPENHRIHYFDNPQDAVDVCGL